MTNREHTIRFEFGSPRWHLVYEALAQFVENHRDLVDVSEGDSGISALRKKQDLAEKILLSVSIEAMLGNVLGD